MRSIDAAKTAKNDGNHSTISRDAISCVSNPNYRHITDGIMAQGTDKRIIIIAGPNGAGKTTFALEYLSDTEEVTPFINADIIASELSPSDPAAVAIRAGRIMLAEIDSHIRAGRSFAFETTLSGKGYLRHINQWRANGWTVKLIFLSLPIPEQAISRVKSRVKQGGHSIPDNVIRRRFHSGLENFRGVYCQCVDDWGRFDTGGDTPVPVEWKNDTEKPLLSERQKVLDSLMRAAKRAHLVAYQTGTKVVLSCADGMMEIEPDSGMYEGLENKVDGKVAVFNLE